MPSTLITPQQIGPEIAEHKAVGIVIGTPWEGGDTVDVRYSARDADGNVVDARTVRLPLADLQSDPGFPAVYAWLKEKAYEYDPYPEGVVE